MRELDHHENLEKNCENYKKNENIRILYENNVKIIESFELNARTTKLLKSYNAMQ